MSQEECSARKLLNYRIIASSGFVKKPFVMPLPTGRSMRVNAGQPRPNRRETEAALYEKLLKCILRVELIAGANKTALNRR